MAGAVCGNCGITQSETLNFVKGICRRCYYYQRRHGTARPPIRENMPNGNHKVRAKGLCRNCRKRRVYSKGLCPACYKYQLGSPDNSNRPQKLYREKCKTCFRPLNNSRRCNGECPACAQYRHANSRPRPERLITKHAPLGWCDCGQPAVHELEAEGSSITNQKIQVKLKLCALHLKEEAPDLYHQYVAGEVPLATAG